MFRGCCDKIKKSFSQSSLTARFLCRVEGYTSEYVNLPLAAVLQSSCVS